MGEEEVLTLGVVKALMETQANAFKSAFKMMIEDIKDDIKSVKSDINDLRESLTFSQRDIENQEKKLSDIEKTVSSKVKEIDNLSDSMDSVDNSIEYLENQSRRNNIKIVGVPEDKDNERSWDDTEKVVKDLIKEKLNLTEEVEIERCHRVGNPNSSGRSQHQRRGGRDANGPRNIVVKLAKWKVKEKILKEARTIKPDGVKFLNDFSSRTLERRADKIPQLIEARKQGKIAYFVMDKLIIKNRPPTQKQDVSHDSEVSFDTF
ncbi:MAG: hypothetical protein GY823_06295 [Flavobacteriaceae bacterium]|nr:hypothetical protein [Flavobacteriaceae bacterium]